LQNPAKLETIGGMAAEMIRGHIHTGRGFAPLSPATAAYRGAGVCRKTIVYPANTFLFQFF
jgi:hypothetical protein